MWQIGWVLPSIDGLLQVVQMLFMSNEMSVKQFAQIYSPLFLHPTQRFGNKISNIPIFLVYTICMAKIFIFRHGQTEDNKQNIFSGWRQSDLTSEGKEEAQQIAEKLKNEPITKAYESDLIRSQHTLEIVLQYHPGVQIIEDPRIKERNYGDLTGTSKLELKEKDPENFELWHRSYDVAPPNGESIEAVENRVLPFLHELVDGLSSDDMVVISAHGNSIRPMRKFFEHLTNEQMCSYEYTPAEIFSYTV